jgi:L-asparagine transporter-like permease
MSESTWLWPGDQDKKRKEFLMPSDNYSIKYLAWLRALTCAYFTFHALLVSIASYEDFWKYLTNLTYIIAMICYHLILWSHVANGDFTKTEYKEPTALDLQKSPFGMYTWCIFFYELSIHLSLTVALAFWMIEMPALCLSGNAFFWGGQRWFELVFSHTLP